MTPLTEPRVAPTRGWPERAVDATRGVPARGRRALRLLVVLAALLVGAALPASAHSTLERSDPPDGGMVAVGRTHLTLWFGEPVDESSSSFSVRGSSGLSSPPVPTTTTSDDTRTVIRLETTPLVRGTYTITWAVLAQDGHPVRGTVTFGAGIRPTSVQASDSGRADPRAVGLRVVDLGGTLLALGSLSMIGGVLTALGSTGASLRRRVLGLGAVGSAAALAASAATPLLTAGTRLGPVDASGTELGSAARDVLFNSTWGVLWLLRLAALALATTALWSARRRTSRGISSEEMPREKARACRSMLLAGGALIVSAGLDAWAGHASTLPAGSAVAAVAATLHMLAAAVWAGGLLVLVFSVVPLMRLDAATRRGVTPAAWRAFGPMAAGSALVLVATGIYGSGRHVESISTASRSAYGLALIGKILLVAIALAIAAFNTIVVNSHLAARVGRLLGRRHGWRPRPHRLATTVTVESVVLAVAVAVAALMTSVPTSREVGASTKVTAVHSEQVDGLFVTFEALPSGSQLRLVVRTQPVVRPEVAPVAGAEVGITAGSSATLTSAGKERVVLAVVEAGRFEGTMTMPEARSWTAEVVVHRTGLPDAVVLVPWSAAPDSSAATPLETAATALSVLLLAGLATVTTILRRRRTGDDPSASGELPGIVRPRVVPEHAAVSVGDPDNDVDPTSGHGADGSSGLSPFEEVGRR